MSEDGLGTATECVLLGRRDSELFEEMLLRLESPSQFVREVACKVLGVLGDRRATPDLLGRLDDRAMLVRRSAAYALYHLKDPHSGPPMCHHYETCPEDINVRVALECALGALGVSYKRHA
jgi:HEAT repeat protein